MRLLLLPGLLWIAMVALCNSVSGQNRVVVSDISIDGNKKTKDNILLRELTFGTGDTLTEAALVSKIEQSKKNLRNTSLFNTIEFETIPTSGSTVDIKITVTERWYFWPYPIVEFVDPNFNLWWETKDLSRTNLGLNFHWQNFRGRNESIYFLGQLGYSEAIGLLYEVPFINKGQRWGLSFAPLYEQRDEVVAGTDNNKRILLRSGTGKTREVIIGSIGLSYRRKLYTTHRLNFKYQQTCVLDTVLAIRPDYLGENTTSIEYLGASYNFRVDKRDNRAYPQEGYFLDAKLTSRGFGVVNKSGLGVLWATIDARKFFDFGRWGFSSGFKGRMNLGGTLPYFFQEGLGYTQYIRGYEYYIIDGQHYTLLKNDIRYTLIERKTHEINFIKDTRFNTFYYAIHASAFFDAGYVIDNYYENVNPLSNDWQGSVGIGLHIETFYDKVVRFEVALNRKNELGYFLHFTQPI